MNDFSLALLGDGIFARWGHNCAELSAELERLYTRSTFQIQNHGLEGSRVGNALLRVSADYEREGQKVRYLAFDNPGIVVVESCAHSQFWDGPEGLSEYRDLLRRVWDEIERTTTAKSLFFLAAPPPRDRFLDGMTLFSNTSKATRARFADGVAMFLDEARSIAQDEGWPLADAAAELERVVSEGASIRRYFDQNDGFHPSRLGYALAAKVIARALDNHRFIDEKLDK
jgi:lysophospholipase L1-like esterase